MKLYEEFKEYENLRDEPLKEAYKKTFENKDYDLTDEDQLKELINVLAKKKFEEYKNLSISSAKRLVARNLELQLRHDGAKQALDVLDDYIISTKEL